MAQQILQFEPHQDAVEALERLRSVVPEMEFRATRGVAFTGSEFAEVTLVGMSAAVAAAIARIVVAWIQAGAQRRVTINGREIRGYSAEDVVRLLSSDVEKSGQEHT